MPAEPLKYTFAFVVVGSFNTVILSPDWMLSKGIVGEEDYNRASEILVHKDLSQVSFDWVSLRAVPNRLEVRCDAVGYLGSAKDFLLNILRRLRETPVTSVGMNHIFYYKLGAEKEYLGLGRWLANLDIWSEELVDPKLYGIEVVERPRSDDFKGLRQIRIEPSHTTTGPNDVVFNINDHFDIEGGVKQLIEIVESEWNDSYKNALNIVESTFKKFYN